MNEILNRLKEKYGKQVVCTNGLYHIYDDLHNEVYIRLSDGQLDKRGKYRTIVVLEDIVVAEVLTSTAYKYVILNKLDLDIIYKTKGIIEYIDNNIMISKYNGVLDIISNHGKVIGSFTDEESIEHMYSNNYILHSRKMYNDKIVYYDRLRDSLLDLTEGKNYAIQRLDSNSKEIEVISMQGGKYIYNFLTRKCFNCFTNREERNTYLWKIV